MFPYFILTVKGKKVKYEHGRCRRLHESTLIKTLAFSKLVEKVARFKYVTGSGNHFCFSQKIIRNDSAIVYGVYFFSLVE